PKNRAAPRPDWGEGAGSRASGSWRDTTARRARSGTSPERRGWRDAPRVRCPTVSWRRSRRGAHRGLGHGLADLVMQQGVELVADGGELGRGHEIGLARVRLVDLDDLFDGAGPGGKYRNAVGEKGGFAQAVRHKHDGLVGAGEQHR